MTLIQQLTAYLRAANTFLASGDLQRRRWYDTRGKLATPSNISRRLRELENDGLIEVKIVNGHAHYRIKQEVPTLF